MNIMIRTVPLVLVALAIASRSAAQAPPSQLTDLVAKARLNRAVAAWCRGEFRGGHTGAFAVAVSPTADSGRYLILEADATVTELAAFADGADLSCYSPAEAEKLSTSLRASETVHGQIAPRFSTSIVCGFVAKTEAICWQYSPTDRAFVRVGGWVT
jgi:hypothetical protein